MGREKENKAIGVHEIRVIPPLMFFLIKNWEIEQEYKIMTKDKQIIFEWTIMGNRLNGNSLY